MPLDIVVTNAGRAALINADNTGTAPVAITHVGLSSAAVVALPTLTALAGEFKRVAAVSGEVVADDTIHLSVMDSSGDSYTLRSVGLYLADGTLFAICGKTVAILEKTAGSDAALSLDVIFADISAALLTFGDATFSNPPASETRQGVAEIATQTESDAGIDDLRLVTPKKNRASFLAWLASSLPTDLWRASNDGAGSGMDADLLDGQHGSWYSDIVSRLGFRPVQNGGGIGQQANPVKIGWAGAAGLKATVDATDLGAFAFQNKNVAFGDVYIDAGSGNGTLYFGTSSSTRYLQYYAPNYHLPGAPLYVNGGLTWTSANDGAGSGMDADLLDGQHGSWYTNIPAHLGFNPANRSGQIFSGNIGVMRTGFAEVSANSDGAAIISMGAQSDGNVGLFVNRGGGQEQIMMATPTIINMSKPLYVGGAAVVVVASGNTGTEGWRIYSDGFKECWGTNSFAGDQDKRITYPFSFSSWSKVMVEGGVNSLGQQENGPFVYHCDTVGFNGLNAANANVAVNWRAWGY